MPRIRTRSQAKQRQLRRSMRQLTQFLRNQKTWLRHAERALRKQSPVETIFLCLNQIHIVLRKSLWIQAQLQLLNAKQKIMSDRKLFETLTHPTEIMPKSVSDKELYAAAYKFDVIDEKTSKDLVRLNAAATNTLRVALEGKADMRKLKKIAKEYMKLNTICIQILELDIEEIEDNLLH